jgi:hypothetical protein
MDISKLDPSKVNIRSVYGELTPEQREHYQQLAQLAEQDKPGIQKRYQEILDNAMKTGLHRRAAIATLIRLRKQQELSFEEMNTRSGIDCTTAAEMEERDADPTIKTLERDAQALGKKLLIVLADACATQA